MNLNLLKNLISDYNNLKSEYLGVSINLSGIFKTIEGILFTFLITLVIFLVGNRIRKKFLKIHSYQFYIDLSLGYICLGSAIGVLGILSKIYLQNLVLIIFLFTLFGYSRAGILEFANTVKASINFMRAGIKKEKIIYFGIFAFLLIAFLRLFTPEIREDAIGYHTTYPHMYAKAHSTMIRTNDPFRILPAPQMGEMLYVITDIFSLKEYSRFINFYFYIALFSLIIKISKDKKFKQTSFTPLIFISTPVIIGLSSSAYTDFQSLLCWLLTVLILSTDKLNKKSIILSGIIFGGMLATKLWTIVFLLPTCLFILLKSKEKLTTTLTFIFFSLLAPLLWYLRAFILTGNPLYPTFSSANFIDGTHAGSALSNFFVNKAFFDIRIIYPFSPLFFLAGFVCITKIKDVLTKLNKSPFFLIFLFTGLEFLIINYPYGRFLLVWYVLFVFFVSYGFTLSSLGRKIASIVTILMFCYYLLGTLLNLPYGLGWADTNKYLTRVLSRDNSSYYDFNHNFDRYISSSDLVATYQVNGFYYANFNHISVFDIFDENHRDFSNLRKRKIKKLFINGGDINWFCNKLGLVNCQENRYYLLSKYTPAPRYLYKIN